MSNVKDVREFAESLNSMLKDYESMQRNDKFMTRVLIQAILTNGGSLSVDPALAEEAENVNYQLEFGDGKITIHGSPKSLWPDGKTLKAEPPTIQPIDPELRMWRTLIRVEYLGNDKVGVIIPGWDPKQIVPIKWDDIPEYVRAHIQPGYRCYAFINIGAKNLEQLRFIDWES